MSDASDPKFQAWVQGYADGSLAPEECVELLEHLRQKPALASELVRALQMDQFIRDTVKMDKAAQLFPGVIATDTPAFKSGAFVSVPSKLDRRPNRALRWMALGAAAMIAMAALSYRVFRAPAAMAELSGASHGVVIRGTERLDARAGLKIFGGDGVLTDAQGSAQLTFPDGTRLDLAPASTVQVGGTKANKLERAGDTNVFLDAGEIEAVVAPQSPDHPFVFHTPQARSVVVGTELKLAVHLDSTRLDVTKGKVRITGADTQATVDVSAGEFAVAAPHVALAVNSQKSIDGLAGAWSLSGGADSIPDNSGHGNGGNTFDQPRPVADASGPALDFDGEKQFIELEKHGVYDGLGRGALMAWVHCGAQPRPDRQMTIFSAQDDDGNMFEFSVKDKQLQVWGGTTVDHFECSAALGENSGWRHVAYVVSDRGNALFIDGARCSPAFRIGSAEQPYFFAQATARETRYRIAASMNTMDECFHGQIKDVRIYSRALSDAEVRALAARR